MARVVELAAGFPGYNSHIPKENGFLSEILREQGYATFATGKWHLSPATEMAPGSRRDTWPLGRGFERYYGFMGGETDQYRPGARGRTTTRCPCPAPRRRGTTSPRTWPTTPSAT